jgi:hypothetical protein
MASEEICDIDAATLRDLTSMITKGVRSTAVLIRHLRQLVDALDRRVPHVERTGEEQIARDARALKEKALQRLMELERER